MTLSITEVPGRSMVCDVHVNCMCDNCDYQELRVERVSLHGLAQILDYGRYHAASEGDCPKCGDTMLILELFPETVIDLTPYQNTELNIGGGGLGSMHKAERAIYDA